MGRHHSPSERTRQHKDRHRSSRERSRSPHGKAKPEKLKEGSKKDEDKRERHRREHGSRDCDKQVKLEAESTSNAPSSKKSRTEREWDQGKLKYEPFGGGSREVPSFAPSGKLGGGFGSGSKDDNNSEADREKPSFEPSGNLAKDTNTFKGVVIKYNEPPEAKIPKVRWRMYPFKGDETLPVIYVHRQSAFLIGKDRKIADFPVDHPSCSRQHAVLQYRSLLFEKPDGSRGHRTRPYIIDLNSANGTYLNGQRIEPQRYYELIEKDILKFAFSTREFVMLSESSVENKAVDDESDEERGGVEIGEEAEKRFASAVESDLF